MGSIPATPIIWLHRITGLVYGPFKAEVGVQVSLGSLWRIRIKVVYQTLNLDMVGSSPPFVTYLKFLKIFDIIIIEKIKRGYINI